MTSSTLVRKRKAHEEASQPLLQTHTVTQHTPPPVTAPTRYSFRNTASNKLQSSQQSDPSSKKASETITLRDLLDFYARWVENGRYIGTLPVAIIDKEIPSDDPQFHQQIEDTVDKISGLTIATLFHIFFKSKYKKIKSINPLYRNFKTLAAAGTQVGIIFADLLSVPQALPTAIFALGIGIIALPYWFYREYKTAQEEQVAAEVKLKLAAIEILERENILEQHPEDDLKKDLEERHKYTRTGTEGWSKYAKTSLVYGMYVGEVVGNIFSFVMRGDILRNISLFGAIGSVLAFVVGVIAVPIINMFSGNKLVSETKDGFRNNYVRSGITLGIAVGAIIGCVITVFIPGASLIVGLAVGSAFGSLIGGAILGVHGHEVTHYLQTTWHVMKDTDNSWDYATRNLSYFFGFVCAAGGFLIGCLVPVPGAALLGSAIGTAVGGALGWVGGLVVIRQARLNTPEEYKAATLPWTQRIANGTMVGSIIGSTLGLCVGLIGGPALAVGGATLGFSLGAVIGGLAYGLYDEVARALIWKYFTGEMTLLVQEDKTPGQELTNVCGADMDVSAKVNAENEEKPTFENSISQIRGAMPNKALSARTLHEDHQISPQPVTPTLRKRSASYSYSDSKLPFFHEAPSSHAAKNDPQAISACFGSLRTTQHS